MYSNAIIAYTKKSDGFKRNDFKNEIRQKMVEADKFLSFTLKKVVQYCYDDENHFAFMDLDTFETLDVSKNIDKYVQLKESKEYVLVSEQCH